MKQLRKYWLLLTVLAIDLAIWVTHRPLGAQVARYTVSNFREMLLVIPPIFVLLGLMDVWVPRETMIRLMGPRSGLRGGLLALFLGAAAAGPLYGAFPVGVTMIRKGASHRNVFIFLGSWSTLKVPMFLFETAALGLRWSITRWLVSVAGTLLIALILERVLTAEDRERMLQNATAAAD